MNAKRREEDRAEGTAPLRLIGDEPSITSVRASNSGISSWLDVMVRLLRLPEVERESVREELEAHLTDRVRDLMVTGLDEAEASRRAIGELGDMAGLAQRFNRAGRGTTGRRIMNIGLLAMAGGAVLFGATTLMQRPNDRVAISVFEPQRTKESAQIAEGRMSVPAGSTWTQFFDSAGRASKLPVLVYWSHLAGLSKEPMIQPSEKAWVTGEGMALGDALSMVNESMNQGADGGVDFRVLDGKLVFSSMDYFDRKETVLATYDLTAVVEERLTDPDPSARRETEEQVTHQVVELISSLVCPDLWRDNGGDRASVSRFGAKLFITAPKRLHPKIRWVLDELTTEARVGAADPVPDDSAASARSAERKIAAIQAQLAAMEQSRAQLEQQIQAGFASKVVGDQSIADLMRKEAVLRDELAAEEKRLKAARQTVTGARRDEPTRTGPATVSVSGLVQHPGTYAMTSEGMTVRRLLAAAGGAALEDIDVSVVTRKNNRVESQYLTSQELLQADGRDIKLTPGDEVTVVRRAPGEASGSDMQKYAIQHVAAAEALNMLMKMQSIRKIDFGDFVADDRTNSIIGKATSDEHALVADALKEIDRPQLSVRELTVADASAQLDKLRVHLNALQAKVKKLEAAPLTVEGQPTPAIREELKDLRQTEAEFIARADALEAALAKSAK